MPNWTDNKLRIEAKSKEDLEFILDEIKGNERVIDFNKIILMPESLGIESGTKTDIALKAIELQKEGMSDKEIKDRLIAESRCSTIIQNEGFDEYVEQIKKNIEAHGHPTWYEFCWDRWGTKWNSHNSSIINRKGNSIIMRFDTAWAPPIPIYEALVEKFRDRLKSVKAESWQEENMCFDENGGFVDRDPDDIFHVTL